MKNEIQNLSPPCRVLGHVFSEVEPLANSSTTVADNAKRGT